MVELSPGVQFAGYRIDGVLGRGGMGVVYRASEILPARTIALKVVAPELASDAGFRARFLREAQLTADIEHPHVIPVLRVGEADGLLFIAMRYVRGSDLAAVISSERRLEPSRAARIVDQVAYALDAAHERGLVHRDVKPANVLIERDRRGEHAYLADFGLTKLVAGSKITATGMTVGTVDYMPPEQFEGGPLDARADVYALGCVLFEALTGRVPYPAAGLQARIFAHMTASPPGVSDVVPGLPVQFDEVVHRALAKQPDGRYQSAGDLGRAALAAAEGRALGRAERSVATGEAASGKATEQAEREAEREERLALEVLRASVREQAEREAAAEEEERLALEVLRASVREQAEREAAAEEEERLALEVLRASVREQAEREAPQEPD